MAVERGFQTPRNRGRRKSIDGDGTFVGMYVFARSDREAVGHFSEALRNAHYKVLQISDVSPNGSNKPWPMDDMFITSQDIATARRTGEVVFG